MNLVTSAGLEHYDCDATVEELAVSHYVTKGPGFALEHSNYLSNLL